MKAKQIEKLLHGVVNNLCKSIEDIIYHMNGVDPLTIQKELVSKCGEYLSIKEIVGLLT